MEGVTQRWLTVPPRCKQYYLSAALLCHCCTPQGRSWLENQEMLGSLNLVSAFRPCRGLKGLGERVYSLFLFRYISLIKMSFLSGKLVQMSISQQNHNNHLMQFHFLSIILPISAPQIPLSGAGRISAASPHADLSQTEERWAGRSADPVSDL